VGKGFSKKQCYFYLQKGMLLFESLQYISPPPPPP